MSEGFHENLSWKYFRNFTFSCALAYWQIMNEVLVYCLLLLSSLCKGKSVLFLRYFARSGLIIQVFSWCKNALSIIIFYCNLCLNRFFNNLKLSFSFLSFTTNLHFMRWKFPLFKHAFNQTSCSAVNLSYVESLFRNLTMSSFCKAYICSKNKAEICRLGMESFNITF